MAGMTPGAIKHALEMNDEICEQSDTIRELREQLDAYKEDHEIRQREIQQLQQRVKDLTAERRGEVWFWDNDGDNNIESLTCPVQIRPEVLQEIFRLLRWARKLAGIEVRRCADGPGHQEFKRQDRETLAEIDAILDKA